MEGNTRLHITDPLRIARRDQKLLMQEEHLVDEHEQSSVKCPCRLCIGSIRSRRSQIMARKHLADMRRHPYHRGRTHVGTFDPSFGNHELLYHLGDFVTSSS